MKLVFIHGREQGEKSSDLLIDEWSSALNQGFVSIGESSPAGLKIVCPFYGKRLDEFVDQLNTPLMAEIGFRGTSIENRELAYRAELVDEMAARFGISDEEIQAQYGGEVHEKGILNWEWVQAILRAMDRTPLGTAAIDAFTRDVYVYLSIPAVRREIDDIVAHDLNGETCVVVGHSLGSVVGYNTLRRLGSQIKVKHYITVGSPLGLRAIKRKLESPITMPIGAEAWFNAYDDGDVVALVPLDAAHFNVRPAILNYGGVDNQTRNQHGISGYLSDPEVARQIYDSLMTTP